MNNEERFAAIETTLAYQEDTIQQLNDVVYNQQKKIDELEEKLRLALDQLKSMNNDDHSRAGEDPLPPHY